MGKILSSFRSPAVLAALVLLAVPPAWGQRIPPMAPAPPSAPAAPPGAGGGDVYGGYMVGIGDILDIRVANEESLTGRYQVDQNGQIHLPLLSGPVPAAGSTTFQLATRLQDELKKQDIMVEPSVTVFIARGMSQNVTVLGAVVRPGVYPIERPTTLLELLSLAGGLQPNAGTTLTIAHRPDGADAQAQAAQASVTSIDLSTLMPGTDPASNVLVRPGDVVTVSTAPVVFVVGSVTRPGAFTVRDSKEGMTVLQAVAMAEGTLPTASLGNAVVVRQSSDDAERQEIPVDLKQVMRGKSTDLTLQANDILFVPESGFKAGLRRVGDIAAQAAGQVVGYGLGVRIGR